MNKRKIAICLIITMVLVNLFSCDKIPNLSVKQTNTNTEEFITSETPYYSVTNGAIIKEKNYYMELEVKIPKITYSNEDSDPVFDPINNEIQTTIEKHIEDSKEAAYNTYKKYLETAKANIENERANKLKELKNKYKSIMGEDEVKAISNISNSTALNIATNSIVTVDGFTSTADIVNAGPHNKKIIIIEKNVDESTSSTIDNSSIKSNKSLDIENVAKNSKNDEIQIPSTTNASLGSAPFTIKGRPGKKPDTNVAQPEIKKETAPKASYSETKKNNKMKDQKEHTDNNSDGINNKQFEFGKNSKFDKNFASKSEITNMDKFKITDEISIENFYKELARIELMRTPNDMILTREYIPMYIYCDFDVKCLDEDFISLYINIYEARTNIVSKVLFYNIDIKNKKLLNIKDILGDNYKEICINSINKTIENWPEEKKVLLSANHNIEDFITDNTTFFINNNHFPVVVFDKYAIAAGAAGYPEFQIIK